MKGAEGRAAGRILVGGDRGFIERERLCDRPLDGEAGREVWSWIVEQHLQLGDIGLPAPFAQLVADEDGGLVIGGRAGDVRLGGEGAQQLPGVFGSGHGDGVGLGFELSRTGPRAKAQRRPGF